MKESHTNVKHLRIPAFHSTEQAMEWGSRLTPQERVALRAQHRALSKAALAAGNLQRMVNLATQAQLMREAAEAVPAG